MVRIVLAVVLVVASISPARAERGNVLITGESLGRIRIGATRDDVFRVYRDHQIVEVDLRRGGQPSPALRIVREGRDGRVQRLSTS